MSHTYFQNYYHIIWSTKNRKPLILNEWKERLFSFLAGSLKTLGCTPLQVGGMNDHIHILVAIPPKYSVSEIVRDLKIGSTKWINSSLLINNEFYWQEGFGSFTVSTSQKEAVIQYIKEQEKHHRVKTFREEFIDFLKIHHVEYLDKYLWV